MKEALLLQGWYQKPDSNWYPWLKGELKKRNIKLHIPDLPTVHTDLPDWEKIKAYLTENFDIPEMSSIIGHSLGSLMGLRLAEEFTLDKLILVSGWDFNDLTEEHRLFWKEPINHKKVIKNVSKVYCISSDNDPYFTYFTNEEMAKRLNGVAVQIKGAGHFTDEFGVKEIPKLLELI